jgi:hypothetical protein
MTSLTVFCRSDSAEFPVNCKGNEKEPFRSRFLAWARIGSNGLLKLNSAQRWLFGNRVRAGRLAAPVSESDAARRGPAGRDERVREPDFPAGGRTVRGRRRRRGRCIYNKSLTTNGHGEFLTVYLLVLVGGFEIGRRRMWRTLSSGADRAAVLEKGLG